MLLQGSVTVQVVPAPAGAAGPRKTVVSACFGSFAAKTGRNNGCAGPAAPAPPPAQVPPERLRINCSILQIPNTQLWTSVHRDCEPCLSRRIQKEDTQGRQGQLQGVHTSMTGLGNGGHSAHIALTTAAIGSRITVEDFLPVATTGHTNPIVIAGHRCAVADD